MKLPKTYNWLNKINPPLMVKAALKLYGTKEVAGSGDNPTILKWADEVAEAAPTNYNKWVGAWYDKDSIPWCGLFMAIVAVRSKKIDQLPTNYLRALAWANFGREVMVKNNDPEDVASLGDVLTFTRKGGGHVGIYIAEDATHYHVLGGNQSDSVSFSRIAKARLYSVQRPIWKIAKPKSVKPYRVKAEGLISTNEA